VDFEAVDKLVSLRFFWNSAPTGTVKTNVDRVQIMRPYRKQYEANIVQADYKVSPAGEEVTVKLNSYDTSANDLLFSLNRKVDILENALRSS
jgi:hypothetical protein